MGQVSALRTLLFNMVFYPLSVVVVSVAPIAAWFGERAIRRYTHGWLQLHRWCARYLLGIRTVVEGTIPDGPALFAAKHQSMYETLELPLILHEPAVVLKKELADIPLWGAAAQRYGMIPVDRQASASALRAMLHAARAARAQGRSVVIFPEGTRMAPGEQPPLQSGFAGLYKALDLPVVPVAVDAGHVWPRKGPKHAGIVTVRFGAVIPPGLPRKEIEALVHQGINTLER